MMSAQTIRWKVSKSAGSMAGEADGGAEVECPACSPGPHALARERLHHRTPVLRVLVMLMSGVLYPWLGFGPERVLELIDQLLAEAIDVTL